jgi:MYXO-CTERM domain-containing protein
MGDLVGGGGGGGGPGLGGALFNDGGLARFLNCTFAENEARGGPGGDGASGLAPDPNITYGDGGTGGGVSNAVGKGGRGGDAAFMCFTGAGSTGLVGGGGGGAAGAQVAEGCAASCLDDFDCLQNDVCEDTPVGDFCSNYIVYDAAPSELGGVVLTGGAGGVTWDLEGAAGGGGAGIGGAIFDRSGFVALDHVTLVTNTAVGGLAGTDGAPIVTAAQDGASVAGGVFTYLGRIRVRNTILTQNTSADGFDCDAVNGDVRSDGYNLFDVDHGCTSDGVTDLAEAAPGVGALNGTTAPLLALSPALHNGACNDLEGTVNTTDQLGAARPDVDCDIGAIEAAESDTDRIFDVDDNCPTVNNLDQADADSDGRGDACDPCPALNTADDTDTDLDGVPDACDPCPTIADTGLDDDGDGVPNACDNCPADTNAGQEDDNGDGVGDVCVVDSDSDGIADPVDNCVDDANADQLDADNDGRGDACEPPAPPADDDGDGVPNDEDNCPAVANPDQRELDGVPRACSTPIEDDDPAPEPEPEGCGCSASDQPRSSPLPGVLALAAVALGCVGRRRRGVSTDAR